MDVHVIFGEFRSKASRDIREVDFVSYTNERTNMTEDYHIRAKDFLGGSPKNTV